MMEVRRALLLEQADVEAFSKTDKALANDFKHLWRRYHNWENPRSLPIVAILDGSVVGLHAATFNKVHVNSYYQLVDPEMRGRRVGGMMVEFLLQEASRLGCTRLKFKTPPDSDGQRFWAGFGARPFGSQPGYHGTDLLYDVSLSGVTCAKDLLTASWSDIPERYLNDYVRRGATIADVPEMEKI